MELRERLQKSLTGSYSLQRELPAGGMSRVFVAEETALGRAVVIKVLPPELAAGVSTERFRREIALAAKLQHPHIVPLFSSGEADGLPYFTMPFVEGESLRTRLTRGALPIGDAISILRDVARALDYAHSHGVVHRDIKPDNVLISGHSATVTDFGVAKALSASTNPGATLTELGMALGLLGITKRSWLCCAAAVRRTQRVWRCAARRCAPSLWWEISRGREQWWTHSLQCGVRP